MGVLNFTSLISTASAPLKGQLTVGPVAVPANAVTIGMQWDVTDQVAGNSAMSATIELSQDGGNTWIVVVQAEREIFAAPTNGVAQFWCAIGMWQNGSLQAKGILTIVNAIATITTSAELMWA